MKNRLIILIIAFLFPAVLIAQSDTLSEIQRIKDCNIRLNNELIRLRDSFNRQGDDIAVLKTVTKQNAETIQNIANDINIKTSAIKADFSLNKTAINKTISTKTTYGIAGFIIAIFVSAVCYLLLHRRNKVSVDKIDKITVMQKLLQEESVSLDNKLVEILNTQVKIVQERPTVSNEPDHSLALKVANEITRIETNLSRMDERIKGYKQLSASVRRVKDNFLANGYEIIDMLGKPYNEGMRVESDFIVDEDLKEGERIITTVIKPQVNYASKIIQKAKIVVSQNI